MQQALDGVRVLELGQLLAGPFAGTVLAYHGAEVIKVEPPGGDPIRRWRLLDGDTSLWWRSLGRNKRCVTLDLRTDAGRDLCRRLAVSCDVLIENFRPGTMERWGLGPDALLEERPSLVYARVSGFGQTGPYAHRPGYASVCEAVGGLRHLIGHPGQAPVRPNISLGDTLGGLNAAIGILLALRHAQATGRGQVVDVALYESVFGVLESTVPEHDRLGVVRPPSGSTITGVVPSNTYRCADGWVVIGANGESIYRRLMHAIDRDDLGADPELGDNPGRVARADEIDGAIEGWTRDRTVRDVVAALDEAEVPVGPILTAADIAADPHYAARQMLEEVQVGGRPLKVPAIPPKLSATPGRTTWAGPEVGEDTEDVLSELLSLSAEEIAELRASGAI